MGVRRALKFVVVLALVGGCSSAPDPTATPTATASGAIDSPSPTVTTASSGGGHPRHTASPGASGKPAPSPFPSPAPTSESPDPTPTPTSGAGDSLPACAYKDVPATGDPNTDWATMVLDTIYRLPSDFAPQRLVDTSKAGMNSGLQIIPALVDDLRAMHDASVADGAEIAVRWAYRSYHYQGVAFDHWVATEGRDFALHYSARPGHSEHQLGTAIDFRSADSVKPPWDYADWALTAAGNWMGENAWRFGFILSYPRGMQDETCYSYEPWHYRYVGRDEAAAVHASGETLRRYLWEHFAAAP